MESGRVIVTAALPYANGSLHIGHLVEYCQADIYVRALKRLGRDALYICANDAHGTPIEVNAGRLGITPEALVARVHAEHQRDFATFDVSFDHFSITHSETNRQIVEDVYAKLRAAGQLVDREVEGNWCETDQRFLPDRYVKGTCPYCSTADQYGDVCESCQRTYSPTELKDPRCILCDNTPVRRTSEHVFFRLSTPENVAFLQSWIDSGTLQPDQANYIRTWFDKGIDDWCISRDGPYFGFTIPDRPGKFFYVWLDAPLGYVASSVEWGREHGVDVETLWRNDNTRIEHIIGKDIVYFHVLFWPAVLRAAGYTLPSKVHVHGMLTIDGHKMSKSRGTFINAEVFAEHIEPQALRYYYACKYSAGTDDLDLALDDFVSRINSELVNKHANLFSRAVQFLHKQLDGRLGDLPFSAEEALRPPEDGGSSVLGLAQRITQHCRQIEGHYRDRQFGQAVRELCAISDIGNEWMQSRAPWNELKAGDEAGARLTCTFALNVCYALATYMWPIVPRFCEAGARILGRELGPMTTDSLFRERNRNIEPMQRLFERIDRKSVDNLIDACKQSVPGTATGAGAKTTVKPRGEGGEKTAPEPGGVGEKTATKPPGPSAGAANHGITFDDFSRIELRVGVVREALAVPKSKKLLRLQIDLGETAPRQVVAGIAMVYAPAELVGRRVVVVANLAPAKLMGVESHGMVLAAGEGEDLSLVRPEGDLPPGARVR